MKLRCPKQHRIGEVCGRKFFDSENTTRVSEDCRLCADIKIKLGRLEKEQKNIRRWREEGSRFESSIGKAERQSEELVAVIRDMDSRRMKNQHAISSRQGGDSGGAGRISVSDGRQDELKLPGGRHTPSSGGYGGGGHTSHDRHSASGPAHSLPYRHGTGGRHG